MTGCYAHASEVNGQVYWISRENVTINAGSTYRNDDRRHGLVAVDAGSREGEVQD